MIDQQGRRRSAHRRPGELAVLRRSRRGTVLLIGWALLCGFAVGGLAAVASLAAHGPGALHTSMRPRDLALLGTVAAALVALCLGSGGPRALAGPAGMALALGSLVLAVEPALRAGAPPAFTAWVAALAVGTAVLHLTHGVGATAVIGTVGLAASLGFTAGLAAWLLPELAPDQPLLVAVTVLSTVGELSELAGTRVAAVLRTARGARSRGRTAALRRESLRNGRVGGTALSCGMPLIAVQALGPGSLAAVVATVLVVGIATAAGGWLMTQLASWAAGGLIRRALASFARAGDEPPYV